jgi:D-alanyl-D-alanine carboxypeptidase (penicillin-binding protein 5/6)
MKKVSFLLAIIVFWGCLAAINPSKAVGQPASSQGQVFMPASRAYILTESSTGQVLAEHNADLRLAPASLTKIMLLLLIAEELNAGRFCLSEQVTASSNAFGAGGSVIWLDTGEVMSAADLVKAVVMTSANDATIALAEHIAGSEQEFVWLMNQKAHVLGMKNTNFVNSAGFDHPEHYSTARDVAIMSRALMREANYPHFSENMLTRLCSVRAGTPRETQLLNTNNLITYYKGIEGIKTGTTDNAGFCLAASALRNDMRLISVVMGCRDNYDRVDLSEKLLDHGFESFELYSPKSNLQLVPPTVQNGVVRELTITELEIPPAVIPKGRAGDIKYDVYLPPTVTAPINRNQPVGTITATLDGEVVYESYVVAAHSVQKLTFRKVLASMVLRFFGW